MAAKSFSHRLDRSVGRFDIDLGRSKTEACFGATNIIGLWVFGSCCRPSMLAPCLSSNLGQRLQKDSLLVSMEGRKRSL